MTHADRQSAPSMQGSADALRDQFEACEFPVDGVRTDELRSRVRDFVDHAKAVGWPPERVIIAVKHLAREAGLQPSRHIALPNAHVAAKDGLLMDVVRWCIERYYAAQTAD